MYSFSVSNHFPKISRYIPNVNFLTMKTEEEQDLIKLHLLIKKVARLVKMQAQKDLDTLVLQVL